MKVFFVLANNSDAPYFRWMAQESRFHKDRIQLGFIFLNSVRPIIFNELESFGHRCYWIPYNFKKPLRNYPSAFLSLIKLLTKLKPDIVHTHLFDDSLPTLLAAKLVGVKNRIITKGDTGFHFRYAPKWCWLDKLNNYNATQIFALSTESKSFILDIEKALPNKVKLVPHGIPFENTQIDVTKIDELKRQLNWESKIIFGVISRFINWKGYDLILSAVQEILHSHPNFVFMFIGDGPERIHYQTIIEEQNLTNRIKIIPHVPPNEIQNYFSLFDAYIHASSLEPFGLVIAEAMRARKIIYSTPTGAASDFIKNGENGFLYRTKEELVELLNNHSKLNNRIEISNNAYHTAKIHLNTKRMFEDHLKEYLACTR